ncbi:hypothetical protein TRFO_35862 [Tritrichomonas foetus]|uniref:RRM domain-containing protein n=1 Tax=Tritrichomonas foetus TaxID=1144522 RepID=A0A1J4JKS0_9EUKA|nr:hypothetical protein TRFO_35862 [Tritrichomonas foetus]|eukprot:OHS97852.1 hypothetical protein TRFO_35862 [Tritrichomonas foetus]
MSASSQDRSQENTIYVGHLPRNSTEDMIHQLLSPYGTITRVTTRIFSMSSNAFVTFATHEEAANAIRECNYTKINGQTIQISWYEYKPKEYAPDSKLVITNLPTSVDESQLHEALEAYGPVVNCSIHRNIRGESTGVGSVQFENADDAKAAHEALQSAMIAGQTITVDFYKPIDKRQDIILKLPPTVICVSGPPELITPENLKSMFAEYGEICSTKVIESYGVVFFENQASVSRANAEFNNPKLTVTTSVRKEIQQTIIGIVESQRVFFSDLYSTSEEEIRAHLETVGKVTSLELRQRSGGYWIGVAQYESEEARNNAIQTLDRSVFGSQVTPIRVLPYYDKRLEHPSAGLLQVNELPCYTTVSALREEMRAHGNVIAISIVATTQGTFIGYVLYEEYSQAQRAHTDCKHSNTFVYPPLSVNDIVGAFCDNLQARIVVCYNVDASETTETFRKKMSPVATVDGIWLASDDGKKTIIFSCMTPSGVVSAVNFLRSHGTDCDVLGVHIMQRANHILTSVPMPKDVRERLLYCSGLGTGTTPETLRKEFESIGAVESAMVLYSPLNNDSTQKGVVLFRESPDAVVALKTPPNSSEFTQNFTVQEFRVRGENHPDRSHSMPAPNTQMFYEQQRQQQQQQQQLPTSQSQHGVHSRGHQNQQQPQTRQDFRPREVMRNFIKKRGDPMLQQKLLEEAAKICVSGVNEIARDENRMLQWLEETTKTLK